MLPFSDTDGYVKKILATPRPGEENVLAFYEHRMGTICKNPRLMLLPLDDHLAHRGDGIFETMKYVQGRIYGLDRHLERMKNSAEGLYLEPPCPWEHIRSAVLQVVAAGEEPRGLVRVLMGRGPGGFGIDPAESPVSSLYIVAYRLFERSREWYEKGLTGFRTAIPAKQGYLAGIKNANYLPNVLMVQEGHRRGMDVPFCFDGEGYLAESATASLCIVDKEGTILAPVLTNALPGTTLRRALELLDGRVRHRLARVTEEDIFSAREALMLSTGPDCVAVVSYEGKPIGDGREGPVAKLLRELIRDDIVKHGEPVPGLA